MGQDAKQNQDVEEPEQNQVDNKVVSRRGLYQYVNKDIIFKTYVFGVGPPAFCHSLQQIGHCGSGKTIFEYEN